MRAVLGEDWETSSATRRSKGRSDWGRPFLIQFLDYVSSLWGGNWGRSLSSFGGVASDRAVGEGRGLDSRYEHGCARDDLGRLAISAQLGLWSLIILTSLASCSAFWRL